MKTKLNCHQVLAGRSSRGGYLQALNIEEATDKELCRARDRVRDCLRVGLGNWDKLISRRDLFEDASVALGSTARVLRPRFRMQGSKVYLTLNEPAHVPPQYIDLDDGLYLPTSFVTLRGGLRPALASRGFFLAVEKILEPLCDKEGWTLERSKPSCIRIVIAEGAHIDLPLYAIPDDEFQTLEESAAAIAADSLMKSVTVESTELEDEIYQQLLEDRIMLAHRSEGWIRSDPRKIEDWFRDAIKDHGPILRRLCRYLKGWRDFQWVEGPLSSIAIMATTVAALDNLRGTLPEGRDDVALLEVVSALPALLNRQISNPVPDLPPLDEGWSPDDRRDMVERAQHLYDEIYQALHGGYHKKVALQRFSTIFGDRIPSDEAMIAVNDEEAEVLSYQPARVSSPMVTRTTSG
ncbi:MAG: CBASS cGAMP synthase [Reyranella sp.]